MPSTDVISTITQILKGFLQRLGRVPLVLLLIWACTLWWGERKVFRDSAAACSWDQWERWPVTANPHHVLFVADPQLVDPHTYPGRPWPLSTLTVLYTDLYMRRMYDYLLQHTQPHTTLFLGDLFDGGREWAIGSYKSPEQRYKKYGINFWLREYNRFMDIFIGVWYSQEWHSSLTGEGRRVIASLPGNHDLGFAGGINEHVRNRFEAHFGPSNRIDILGNHSFVSLDTVSLSAMDQVDPATGSSGLGDGTGRSSKHADIWKPVENFLIGARKRRAKAVQRRYEYFRSVQNSNPPIDNNPKFDHQVSNIRDVNWRRMEDDQTNAPSSSFPTILLSHVPLYRDQDVKCGPQREKGDAIPLSAGYQYQNVLTPAISKDIVDRLDAEQVTMIYSGDDHDYCEIEHGEFTGQIKEITVKSMSWAMGVRRPGVQLASLWNPVDIDGIAQGEASTSTPRDTVQNHLCLLPDQLGIFIRYGEIAIFSLLVLLIRAITFKSKEAFKNINSSTSPADDEKSQPLLPISRKLTPPLPSYSDADVNSTVTLSSTTTTPNARARSTGKLNGYGNIPVTSRSSSPTPTDTSMSTYMETDDWGMPVGSNNAPLVHNRHRPTSHINRLSTTKGGTAAVTHLEKLIGNLKTPASTKPGEFVRSVALVGPSVLFFYFWLLWHG